MSESGKIAPMFGDITDTDLDVILNPCSLAGGTGQVGSAISRRWPTATDNINVGGDSKRFQLVKVPSGTGLKCKFVMHAACSRDEDEVKQVLRNCDSSLKANNIKSLAIPLIGAGQEGRDPAECARDLVYALVRVVVQEGKLGFLDKIFIVTYDRQHHDLTKSAFDKATGSVGGGMRKTAAGAGKGAAVPKPVDKGSAEFDQAVAGLPPDLRALVDGVDTIGLADDVTADSTASAKPAAAAAPKGGAGGASKNRVTMVQRDSQGQITGQIHFVNSPK